MEGLSVLKSVAFTVAGVAVAGALLSSPALADGGYPLYGAAPQEPVLFAPLPTTWTGFYIGAHAGGGFANSDWEALRDIDPVVEAGDQFSHEPDGWLAGGQLGYNFQTGRFVWGIEGTISGADINETTRSRFADIFLSTDIDLLWTVTGRLGFDWGRALTYVKAGYAGANVELSASDRLDVFPGFTRVSDDNTHHGWTVGAGIEVLATNNIVLGLEYNFYDLGEEDYGDNLRFTEDRRPFIENDVELHTVTARLSYKFGPRLIPAAAPVVPLK